MSLLYYSTENNNTQQKKKLTGIPLAIPMSRYPVVVEGPVGQRALADQRRGVRVQALLLVHYPVDRVLHAARLPHRAMADRAIRASRAVARYHRASLDPPGRHRLGRNTVVLDHRGLRLRVLDAVQRPQLLLLLLLSNLRCMREVPGDRGDGQTLDEIFVSGVWGLWALTFSAGFVGRARMVT